MGFDRYTELFHGWAIENKKKSISNEALVYLNYSKNIGDHTKNIDQYQFHKMLDIKPLMPSN